MFMFKTKKIIAFYKWMLKHFLWNEILINMYLYNSNTYRVLSIHLLSHNIPNEITATKRANNPKNFWKMQNSKININNNKNIKRYWFYFHFSWIWHQLQDAWTWSVKNVTVNLQKRFNLNILSNDLKSYFNKMLNLPFQKKKIPIAV